jgi:hypothetical protein
MSQAPARKLNTLNATPELSHRPHNLDESQTDKRWFDGTHHTITLDIDGNSDIGIHYTARAVVFIRTWTDKVNGQYVLTTDIKLKNFIKVDAYVDRVWSDADYDDVYDKSVDLAKDYLDRVINDNTVAPNVVHTIIDSAHKLYFGYEG